MTSASTTTADLFADAPLPHGLLHRPDFITADEERALLASFESLPFHEALFQQYTARRRVVHFGATYDEKARRWVEDAPLPAALARLRGRAAAWLALPPEAFVHALVTEYRPGTPIGWHRDRPWYGSVVGISLASACRMQFRRLPARGVAHTNFALDLAPRSAYALTGEIRWRWHHHIAPVNVLRYSITFRTRATDDERAAWYGQQSARDRSAERTP